MSDASFRSAAELDYDNHPAQEDERDYVDERAIHDWFGLTYASYLVLPRVLLQEMPGDWQATLVDLLEQMADRFNTDGHTDYSVQLRDGRGRFLRDPLSNYRHPDQGYINSIRRRAPDAPRGPAAGDDSAHLAPSAGQEGWDGRRKEWNVGIVACENRGVKR